MLFRRHIAIDWSGAGLDSKRNRGLAVAEGDGIVAPPKFTTWSRDEVDDYLRAVLRPDQPRTIVAIDAALSFPDGFQQAAFGVNSWLEMVDAFSALRRDHQTAREIACAINDRAGGAGPFRFNESRNDNSFYREHGIAYYRAVELLMPQCISPFYMGSGATVGFHAITSLCTVSRLIRWRETGEVAFRVWPQEGAKPGPSGHLLVECYPAMYPLPNTSDVNEHERDALRTSAWMVARDAAGALIGDLRPQDPKVGRRAGRDWREQFGFEGWVLGT